MLLLLLWIKLLYKRHPIEDGYFYRVARAALFAIIYTYTQRKTLTTTYPSQYMITVLYKDDTEHTYFVRKTPCKTRKGFDKQLDTVTNEAAEPQKPYSFNRITVDPIYPT